MRLPLLPCLLLAVLLPVIPGQVIITEFMAHNGGTLDDQDGDSSD